MPRNQNLDMLNHYRRSIGNQPPRAHRNPLKFDSAQLKRATTSDNSSLSKTSRYPRGATVVRNYSSSGFNPKFIFFILMTLLVQGVAAEQTQEDAQEVETYPWNNCYPMMLGFTDPCLPYKDQGLNYCDHSRTCYLLRDEVVSLEDALLISPERVSNLDRVSYLIKYQLAPMRSLVSLPPDVFDYFANFYHERIIGLARFIAHGKLSYQEALDKIHQGMPYQLRNTIVHSFIVANKLTIHEAEHIDSATMGKLMQYGFPPGGDGVYGKLISEAGFTLNDFVKYPVDLIYHITAKYYLVNALVNRQLTPEQIQKLRKYTGYGFHGRGQDETRLLNLILQKIVEVDFVASLTHDEAVKLNAFAGFIKEGLPISEVLAVPGEHLKILQDSSNLMLLAEKKSFSFAYAIELIQSNRHHYFTSLVLCQLYFSAKINMKQIEELAKNTVDFLIELEEVNVQIIEFNLPAIDWNEVGQYYEPYNSERVFMKKETSVLLMYAIANDFITLSYVLAYPIETMRLYDINIPHALSDGRFTYQQLAQFYQKLAHFGVFDNSPVMNKVLIFLMKAIQQFNLSYADCEHLTQLQLMHFIEILDNHEMCEFIIKHHLLKHVSLIRPLSKLHHSNSIL